MSQQDKDSLENFFRERTQGHNLEFNEGDWLKLEKQLDRELPVAFTFFSILKRFWIIPLAIFLLPLTWLSYNYYSDSKADQASQIINTPESISASSPNSDLTSINGVDPQLNPDNKYDQTTIFNNHSTTEEQKIVSENKTNSKGPIGFSAIKKSALISRDQSKKSTGVIKEQDNIEPKNLGQVDFGEGAKSGINTMDNKLLFLSAIPPDFIFDEPSLTGPSNNFKENEVLPAKFNRSFFKVGLGYSPDFSTVGIGNFVSPGSRWTAIIEYGFFNRFVMNTGIVLVDNKYEAYGEDYHAPSRYWKKGIVADEAYGECKMIDIPLNLRYNLISKEKNKVFVSAGASTYFVLKEDYYFHYENEDPDLPDHWGTEKMTVYPFGIINLSFGYEYQFSRKSGIQIEPFIKIPTTGIGWGNVDLHTMGVYFMYKYKLSK
jgi:hypothetical protein